MMDIGVFSESGNPRIKRKGDALATSTQKRTTQRSQDDITGTIIVSVVESRGREVCISKIDTRNGSVLELYILQDCHSYAETINLLNYISPHEVLLADGNENKVLSKKIESMATEDESHASVLYISRQYFDQDKGADMLKRILVGIVDSDIVSMYIVLAGTYCLLRYIENCTGSSYASNSLRLDFCTGTSGRTSIDHRTAVNLELITNAKDGNQKESLFGIINHTKTVVGARFLRSNILRPNIDIATIQTRLDMVEILLQKNKIFADLVVSLSAFPDLDKMLTGFITVPKTLTAKTAKISIDTLIYLKQTLKVIPSLAAALHDLIEEIPRDVDVCTLMQALYTNLTSPSVNELQDIVDSAITESTTYSKSAHEMRHQECFALRCGLDGLLDVARKSFLQTVEDIHEKIAEYSDHYKIPIKVVFTVSRGYHMSIPTEHAGNLPPIFIQAIQNKRSINCTSDEIASLTDRSSEAINKALIITNNLIQELLDKVRRFMEFLFSVTDSVALLDMMQSFATLIAYSPHPYTRPVVKTSGPMVIKSGRHPIISMLPSQETTFVANDTFLDKNDNMIIITGANGSGKTVHIKQVALIVILTQIGCFVSALHATVPIRDKILSRIGTYDDMENNISTFFMEMTEASYIVDNLTDKSLIIIDELGRGTSNVDGISLAFSICEHLALSGSMTLFVTHYPQLTQMSAMYRNIRNVHFKVQCNSNANDDEIVLLHSIGQGTCDMMSGYGISMARICGFPQDMVNEATEIQKKVRDMFPLLLPFAVLDKSCSMTDVIYKQLTLLRNSTLDDTAFRQYLSALRSKISPQATADILRYLSMGDSSGRDFNINTTVAITNTINTTIIDNIYANDDCNNGNGINNNRLNNNENIDNINIDDFLNDECDR